MTRLWANGEPIAVTADDAGLPLRFTWRRQTHEVTEIVQRWRLHTDWWRIPIWRDHFKLTTETGLLVIIYHELAQGAPQDAPHGAPNGGWYLQRLYD